MNVTPNAGMVTVPTNIDLNINPGLNPEAEQINPETERIFNAGLDTAGTLPSEINAEEFAKMSTEEQNFILDYYNRFGATEVENLSPTQLDEAAQLYGNEVLNTSVDSWDQLDPATQDAVETLVANAFASIAMSLQDTGVKEAQPGTSSNNLLEERQQEKDQSGGHA